MTTTPSAAMRPAFLAAFAWPDLRMASMAASILPWDSTRAFLHSIMPAPVRSLSSLTNEAVISIKQISENLVSRICPARALGPARGENWIQGAPVRRTGQGFAPDGVWPGPGRQAVASAGAVST